MENKVTDISRRLDALWDVQLNTVPEQDPEWWNAWDARFFEISALETQMAATSAETIEDALAQIAFVHCRVCEMQAFELDERELERILPDLERSLKSALQAIARNKVPTDAVCRAYLGLGDFEGKFFAQGNR